MSIRLQKPSRMLATFVATGMALAFAHEAVAKPRVANATPRALTLEVTVGIGGDGEALETAIANRLRTGIAQGSSYDIQPNADVHLTVDVGWKGESRADYAVVATVANERVLAHAESVCELCNSKELLTMVDAQVATALSELQLEEPPPEAKPAPVVSAPEVAPASTAKRVGPLGWGGLALLVAGTGTAVAGGILIGKGKEETLANDTRLLRSVNYRRPGIIVLSVGTAAALAGGAMFVIDQVRRRPSKREIAMAPVFGFGMAGVALAGKF